MNVVVMKFGGTSQNKTTYDTIHNIISTEHGGQSPPVSQHDTKFIIVLSAMTSITSNIINYIESNDKTILNHIISINVKLASQCNIDISDIIVEFISKATNCTDNIELISMGETFTCSILERYLNLSHTKCKLLHSKHVICSDTENIENSYYNKGEFKADESIIKHTLLEYKVVIIQGFSGRTPSNKVCILSRGGSDTSGSIIASAVKASRYEIFTDVDGIFSSDPNKISNTVINKKINYKVAQELATMGARVIHPLCIMPCAVYNIPIHIKNYSNPQGDGTVICNTDINAINKIYSITIQKDIKIFKIESLNMWNNYGLLYSIFEAFKDHSIDVNIVSTSQFEITVTVEERDAVKLENVKNILQTSYNVSFIKDCSIVSIISDNIKTIHRMGDVFKLVESHNIIMTVYSSNNMTLSFVLPSTSSITLAQDLHTLLVENASR